MPEGIDFTKISLDLALDPLSFPQEETTPSSEETPEKKEEETTETTETPETETPATEEEVEKKEGEEEGGEGEEETELSLFDDWRQKLGIEVEGEFSEDETGLYEFTVNAGKAMAQKAVEEKLSEFQPVKELYEFIKRGGDPSEFMETMYSPTDYEKVTVEDEDTTTQENIVREHYKLQGYSAEEVTEAVNEFKNSDLLASQARRSLKALQNIQKQEKETLQAEVERKETQAKQQAEALRKDIESVVTKNNDLSGLPLPETKKKEFIDYLMLPVKDGKTAAQLAGETATLEQLLALELFRFHGYDLSGIVARKAQTQRADRVRSLLEKKRDTDTPSGGVAEQRTGTPNFANLDIL